MNMMQPLGTLGSLTGTSMWGPNAVGMTPQQMDRQKKLIEAMEQRAGDTSPIGHWTQGAARVADALVANVQKNRLEDLENAQAGFPARPGGFLGLRPEVGTFFNPIPTGDVGLF